MDLELLLKPIKAIELARKSIDGDILRGYSKLTKLWEDKGRNIYHITTPISFASLYLTVTGINSIGINSFSQPLGLYTQIPLYTGDFSLNIYGFLGLRKRKDVTSGSIVANKLPDRLFEMINKTVRLPTFLGGIGFLGKVGYDIGNYVLNNEPFDINEQKINLTVGLGLLGHATSMYLKDGDPKLLDKEPLLETVSKWVYEKLIPKVSKPARFELYTPLESRVQVPY